MGILGIDLGGTNVRAGLVEDDKIIKIESLSLKKNCSAEDVLKDIYSLVDHFSGEEILGIGVGVPSVVDIEKGIVYDVQNIPSWKEVPLRDLLKEKCNVPVYINNDANCFAAGEKYFGKTKSYKNIVGLILGTGLGAGIIINNKLYEGRNCGAGEFGMIPYKNKNFEYFCSGHYFTDEFVTTGKDLFIRAKKGDAAAIEIFSMFGTNLGEVIKVIMYSYDPEVIVLGGSVSKAYEFFEPEMRKSISEFAYSNSIKNLKIEVSEIENISVLGAAALYYNDIGK
jgi:glucokinase